jgi:hypothetical protein
MTTSPSELLLRLLVNGLFGLALIASIPRSIRRGYAIGFFWDFQRQSEPKRFWTYLAFISLLALASTSIAVQAAIGLLSQ